MQGWRVWTDKINVRNITAQNSLDLALKINKCITLNIAVAFYLLVGLRPIYHDRDEP